MSDWRGRYFNDMHSPVGANKAIFTDEDGNRERCFSGAWCWACDQEHIRVLTARAEAAEAEVERLTADFNAAVERIHELLAEKVDREAAIQRVRELHSIYGEDWPHCNRCHEVYPCDTLHALDGGDDA